jgi:hypothetical protein
MTKTRTIHRDDAREIDGTAAATFVTAGHAIFTLVSKATGTRFTFTVERAKAEKDADGNETNPDRPWFVGVLTGPNNTVDYSYMGLIFPANGGGTRFVHPRKSHVSPDAPSAKAFSWFFAQLTNGSSKLDQVEIWHMGCCGRCGRALSVPESIALGFGPVCASLM